MENNALLIVKILLKVKPVNPSHFPLALQYRIQILTVSASHSTWTHNIPGSCNKFVFLQFGLGPSISVIFSISNAHFMINGLPKSRLCMLRYRGNTTKNFDLQVICQCSGITVVHAPETAKNSLKKRTNSFPAIRGLPRRGKMKREERDLCWFPMSCLMKPPTQGSTLRPVGSLAFLVRSPVWPPRCQLITLYFLRSMTK